MNPGGLVSRVKNRKPTLYSHSKTYLGQLMFFKGGDLQKKPDRLSFHFLSRFTHHCLFSMVVSLPGFIMYSAVENKLMMILPVAQLLAKFRPSV